MREIKFRAWHKKRKKFYEVLHLHIKSLMNGGIWATCRGKDCIEQQDVNIQVQPDDCIIEQFTGLLDKNGVEIYEGDIFIYWGENCVLEWLDGGYEIRTVNGLYERHVWLIDTSKKVEVIGNIHEDSSLLGINS